MYYTGPHDFGFAWFLFGLVWIVIFVAIFALLAGGRRHHFHGGQCHRQNCQCDQSKEGPLDIVKERYAKGEINKEEFERLKKDLQDN
jgi:putative membrane protein